MTWLLFSGGFFLCAIGLSALRNAARTLSGTRAMLARNGIAAPPLPGAMRALLVLWFGEVTGGCALLWWAWVR